MSGSNAGLSTLWADRWAQLQTCLGACRSSKIANMSGKTLIGVLFFVVDLVVLAVGGLCIYAGIQSIGSAGGEGGIKLVVQKLGEVSGMNGSALILAAGLAMVLAALGYALKAYQEAVRHEGGLKDTVRHFAPMQPR